jgi:hypothetical protein
MQLSVTEDVLLLREMPEAKIALLLKEFATPPEGGGEPANAARDAAAARILRAKEIFDRITKGEPRESIIRSALNNVQQAESERPSATANK